MNNKTITTYFFRLLFIGLLLLCTLDSLSQAIYPVQATTQVISPYTPYVPRYYTGTQEKLRVTLTNMDMQEPTLDVYLRMKITSSSFSIITPPEVYTPTIKLQAGVPLQLSLNDLEPYFKKENMRISGGQSKFYQTMQLPDNFYRFQFDVYEVRTNRLLSNPRIGFSQMMIAAGEPPFLNLPRSGSRIKESNIPNILFTWTPRHMNSIASAYGTEYEFTLVEIFDKRTAPENAFQYSKVLYSDRTRATAFTYTAAHPMLIPGMRYAWRVRAIAKEGIEDTNIFKNEGYSQIYWFDYTVDCPVVNEFGAVLENMKANITWVSNKASDYTVEYRKKGSNKWYTGNINNDNLCTIHNLKYSETYEYRIGSRCLNNDDYQYSDVKAFTLPSRQEKSPNCGLMPNVNLTDRTPIRELITGIPIFAGDFPVTIMKVTNSNGRFTGEGYVGIPYMKLPRVAVTFKNIQVNSQYQLIDGYFETKFDLEKNMIWNIDKTLNGGKNVGDIRSGEEFADFKVDYTINPDIKVKPLSDDRTEDEIKEGKEYTIKKNENGKYQFVITDSEGKEHKIESDKIPVTIQDKAGNTYEINEKGEVTTISQSSDIYLDDETKDNIRTDIAEISFENTENSKYALDIYLDVYKKVTDYYQTYKPSNRASAASAKFMVAGQSDEIFVKLNKANIKDFDPNKVHFITSKGKEYNKVYDNNKQGWTVTLLGSDVNDGQECYVVYDETANNTAVLARLNLYSYASTSINVKLIPVNGFNNNFTQASVEKELNAIYNKVGITCHVEMASSFEYEPLKNGSFKVDGSGFFATQTNDMKLLNTAYLSENPDEKALCLFIIQNVDGSNNILGDMPRGKQFGYLFKGSTSHTIAHEIGHGLFHLDHPFARANGAKSFDKGDLSDNLMEYQGGTHLAKLQWDMIYSPGLVIGIFEKDADGMIQLNGKALGFTPNGQIVRKRPDGYNGKFNDDKGFISQFSISETTSYKWVDDAYYLNGDKQSTKFVAWDVDSKGKELPSAGDSVAIWKDSKYPKCYTLYRWIVVNKGYTSANFSSLKAEIESSNNPKWEADWVYDADKTTCRDLFEQEKKELEQGGNTSGGSNTKIYNYTKELSSDKIKQVLSTLDDGGKPSTQKYTIYITDTQTDKAQRQAVKVEYEKIQRDDHVIWVDFDEKGEASVLISYAGIIQNDFLYACTQYIARALNMQNVKPISLSSMFDGLSFVIGKMVIPPKYYDPYIPTGDYDPIIADIYRYSVGIVNGTSINDYMGVTLDGQYGRVELEVAFSCGVWNGAVETLKGIPDLASLFTKLILNEDGMRDQMREIKWDDVKKMVSDEWSSVENGGPFVQSHFAGRVVLEIATFYVAWAKIGKVSKIGTIVNAIDKLNVLSQTLKLTGLVIKFTGKTLRITGDASWTFLRVVVKGMMNEGKLFALLPVPSGTTISNAYKAAFEKVKTAFNKGEIDVNRLVYELAEDGTHLVDENGNKIAKIVQDGQEILVVVSENSDNLAKVSNNIVQNLDEYLTKLKSVLGEKQAKQLAKDFGNNVDIIAKIADDEALTKAWRLMNEGGLKTAKTNIKYLENFAKLSNEVQETLSKFSDKSFSSLMDDVVANPALTNFLNDPLYDKIIKGFVAHKLNDAVIHDIGGFLADEGLESLTKAEREFAEKWLQHSKEYSRFTRSLQLGNELSDNIVKSLQGKTKIFNDLAKKLGMSTDELALYEVFKEVPLNTSGGFMKADAMLIKRNADNIIEDVILIENKLSKGTAYTQRQIEGFTAIGRGEKMKLRYVPDPGSKGNKLDKLDEFIIDTKKCFRLDDHGTNSINKVEIEQINFSKFK